MKRIFVVFLTGVLLPLTAVDFDFTANPPLARGKVPMLKLDDSLRIGGTSERTALNFDGKSQITIPGSAHLGLQPGLTVAMELESQDKGDGKNCQMIVFKRNEWLIYRVGNRLDFLWKSNKKWVAVYRKNMTFEKPHKFVITLDKDRKFNFYLDGRHIRVAAMDALEKPNPNGKELVTLGGGWNKWDFKGDIYQLRIFNKVWSKNEIEEFFK